MPDELDAPIGTTCALRSRVKGGDEFTVPALLHPSPRRSSGGRCPGGAWYESGPDPVFAQAAAERASRFIRVMILPRALLGKSSIELLNEEDKTKPRSQQYKIFADAPIAFRRA